jgi:predicted RNA binding protein YcfA (HicA-like mRNA interferase family)
MLHGLALAGIEAFEKVHHLIVAWALDATRPIESFLSNPTLILRWRLRHVRVERMPLKVREVIRRLQAAGWRHIRTAGDHRIFRSGDGRTTVISGKLGDDVRPGTYRAILRQTGIEDESK